MNREILFKAKRKDNGEWVEGVPLTEGWSKKTYIITFEYSSLVFIQQIEVDPSTVCQYTGLTDKNGTKIFEGDIIQEMDKKFEVYFSTDRGGWYPFACGDGCGCCENETIYVEWAEVIGNIFDNKDLIKE